MANNTNKILREGYDRLKKTLEKIINPKKEQPQPQLVLQPIRNRPAHRTPCEQTGRKYLRGNSLRISYT
jgi:hypothetical protein